MSRLTLSILGALVAVTAKAPAQSTIEPPRRTAPPAPSEAAPATPAPAAPRPVALPGASPAAADSGTPSAGADTTGKPPIATGRPGIPEDRKAQIEALRAAALARRAEAANAAASGTPAAGTAGSAAPGSTPAPGTTGLNLPSPAGAGNTAPSVGGPTSGPPGPARTAPGLSPAGGPGAGPGGSAQPRGPLAKEKVNAAGDAEFVIDQPQATVDDAIAEYERVQKVTVLRASNLQGTVPLVINSQQKMNQQEYVDYLKAALMVNGWAIHEYSPTIHAVTFNGQPTPLFPAVAPRDGHRVYTRLEDLPDRDEFVNYFMKLTYLSPTDAQQIFQKQHQSGNVIAVPNAGGLFIQESVPVVKSMIAMKERLDVGEGPISKFVELKIADAEEVAQAVQQIIQSQSSGGRSGSGGSRVVAAPNAAAQVTAQLQGTPTQGAPAVPGGVTPALDPSSVIVQSDRRTNRILLFGPKTLVTNYEKLIQEFDRPSNVTNLVTYPLRYIRVGDFIDLAAGALEARGFGSSTGGGAGGTSRTSPTGSTAGGGGQSFQDRFQNASQGSRSGSTGSSTGGSRSGSSRSSGGTSFGGGGSGGSSRGGYGSSSNQVALPASTVVGKTLLISDPQSNSIIVSGPPEGLEQIRLLITEMDKRPLQVFIDCVIAEITLGDTIEFGIDLLRRVDSLTVGGSNVEVGGLFRTIGEGSTGIIDPVTLTTVSAFETDPLAGATGLNSYLQVGELVNAYVRASEGTNRLKIIQKPSLATANNEPGFIAIGRQVPYPGQQTSSLSNNDTLNSTVEYKDVLLSLDVTPLINSKNEVTLQISQINDNVIGTTTINNDPIPIIGQQELNTKLTVPNGGIAVLGGLIFDSRQNDNNGAPFLARIPVLKYLLGNTKKKDDRRELLIFIQPRIMETADEMIDINSREIQRTMIGVEAEKFARPPRDTSDVQLPTANGEIPFDSAGYNPAEDPAKQGFWKRLGNAFRRKRSVPQDSTFRNPVPAAR